VDSVATWFTDSNEKGKPTRLPSDKRVRVWNVSLGEWKHNYTLV